MTRHTRYQGAIIDNHRILLIQHREHTSGRTYWVIPGGGLNAGESEEEYVIREMKEETNLEVEIEHLVFDEPADTDAVYHRRKTYLCRPIMGEASPGYEPELEASSNYSISEVRWFDLRNKIGWRRELREDPFTYPQLLRLAKELGCQDT